MLQQLDNITQCENSEPVFVLFFEDFFAQITKGEKKYSHL